MIRKGLIFAAAAISTVVSLCLLAFFGIRQIPPISEQIPPASSSIHVLIKSPTTRTGWPLNHVVPVQAHARGPNPITELNLFINGFLYASSALETA